MGESHAVGVVTGIKGDDNHVENHFSWHKGSVLMRTQGLDDSCSQDFFRDDIAIGIIVSKGPGSEATWHLDGRLVLDKTWTSSPGERYLVVLPPRCEFRARGTGAGEELWLFIKPESIAENVSVKRFSERMTVDCSWSKDRLAWAVISEIRDECLAGFPRGPLFIESAATVFFTQLAYLFGQASPRSDPPRALSGSKLQLVIDHFENNLHRNLTLLELSGLVALTPRYFCKAFKDACGRPPHQFQIERRLERAKTLLCDPALTLANVALMVGFSSQSHLNSSFRRSTGVTPARYRAEHMPRSAAESVE
jgi:AraC family transcriptional regulator